jgi:putative membrane protein
MTTLQKSASHFTWLACALAISACSANVSQGSTTAPAPAAPTNAPVSATVQAPGETDEEFVESAAQLEAGRYALGVLGAKRAHASVLRTLGQQLSSQSAATTRWLAAYARNKRIPIETRPKTRAMYQYSQLEGRSGADFDRAYAQTIATDVQIALDTFAQQIRTAKDPALREFAGRVAAQLESNLKQAQAYGT